MPNSLPFIRYFTSESVTEGHPDKLADQISDAILDAVLAADPAARVAVETLLTGNLIVLGGEITANLDTPVDYAQIARDTVLAVGYDSEDKGLDGNTCEVLVRIGQQSPEIFHGVFREDDGHVEFDSQGAGDQGIMFGFASDETEQRMPLAITVAHELAAKLAEVRKNETLPYLRPDGKTQVTVGYDGIIPVSINTILISSQHDEGITNAQLENDILAEVIYPVLDNYKHLDISDIEVHINPSGSFVLGGPAGDAGLTGRKIIVDTYGGAARHGGGAFSGKDPSKVDRTGAYATRWIAKTIVDAGFADQAEVQVAYAIGESRPLALYLNTYGTGTVDDDLLINAVQACFDLRPAAMVHDLELLNTERTKFSDVSVYGHFGGTRVGQMPTWECTEEKVEALQNMVSILLEKRA